MTRAVGSPRAAALAGVGMLALLAGCFSIADPPAAPTESATAGRGAPSQGLPQDLAQLLDRTDQMALQWQAEPRLAELSVSLEQQRWTGARVLYVAADADRFLSVAVTPEATTQQRPTLATLASSPLPPSALEELAAFPEQARAPEQLVHDASEALEACEVGPVTDVLYATGAPVAWDGTAWTQPPQWTATLVDEQGAGVAVDPRSGEPAGTEACL